MLLTIAIPTYNRKDCLKQAIDNILPQMAAGVEIFIKDNASTDGTRDLIEEYTDRYNFIRYSRNKKNIGPDANFLLCLKESSGKFVHLLSDDDILLPGAISTILDLLNEYSDAAVIRTNCCSFEKDYTLERCSKPSLDLKENLVFRDKNKFLEYIGFSSVFMSTTIYNRQYLIAVENPEQYIGTNLLQTHLLFACVSIGKIGIIMDRACVAARVGMPVGFDMSKVLLKEWKLVLYNTCVDNCGFDNKTIDRVYIRSLKENIARIIINKRLTEKKYCSTLTEIFPETWKYSYAWIHIYPFMLLPAFAIRMLSKLRKQMLGM
jgi:glycosyltransferase involved in cell wall biosynthesis